MPPFFSRLANPPTRLALVLGGYSPCLTEPMPLCVHPPTRLMIAHRTPLSQIFFVCTSSNTLQTSLNPIYFVGTLLHASYFCCFPWTDLSQRMSSRRLVISFTSPPLCFRVPHTASDLAWPHPLAATLLPVPA
jgi:hypothetical protein